MIIDRLHHTPRPRQVGFDRLAELGSIDDAALPRLLHANTLFWKVDYRVV